MKGSGKPTLNIKEVTKWWPKFQDENKASIGDYWAWKTMVIHYYVYYNIYKLGCINSNFDWFRVDHFCEPIYDN